MVEVLLLALIAGMPALLTAAGGFLKVLKEVKQVHQIVYSQQDALLRRIDELEKQVTAGLKREEMIAEIAMAPKSESPAQ